MAAASLLARLGIYVADGFLDPELCANLIAQMRAAQEAPATVYVDGDPTKEKVDDHFRRTRKAEVSPSTAGLVHKRLLTVKPELERRFSTTLEGCRPPQFLRYLPGDFFRAHYDGDPDGDAAEEVVRRQVSAVTFLNDESTGPRDGCYAGGALTFYGLLEAAPRLGLPVEGRAGRLVAFDARLLHAVTPVIEGERCTLVTFFLEGDVGDAD